VTHSATDAIVVDRLEKKFGHFVAVDRISFSVSKGEIFGFLGANGSGKSTTIRMLCGILSPTSGGAFVGGHDIVSRPEAVKQSIGYMSQKFSLYEDLTPVENIRFYLGIYNVKEKDWPRRMSDILHQTRLDDFKNRVTKDLPAGWRQRLALGCALVHQPKILFLDEPTSGVDPVTRAHFWRFIRKIADQGITVFVTTHYMEEAQWCGRIVMINAGKIVESGSPSEIIASACPGAPEADLNDAFIKLMSRAAE